MILLNEINLRPYQEQLISDIRSNIKNGKKSICAVLSCGGGKSIIQGCIAKSATDKGNRVLFLVHRKELCEQIRDTFKKCKVDFSLCDISMVQTVTRRLGKISAPTLIITDETHHSLSRSYINIYEYFNNAIRLGFTATPIRLADGGLGKIYESLITSVSTKWLIENNYLSPYKYYSIKLADNSNLHTKRGDFDNKEIADLMENNVIYGETLKNYHEIANGKKTIIYCASIESSKKTIEQFINAGIKSAHVDGTTPPSERERIISKFRSGEITVLSNVDLFGEGFDVPDCECVILLRPTKSLTLYIQQSMRSMRYKEGKTAIIIDHVANVYIHDLPDVDREWSLNTKKKKAQGEFKIKQCENCLAVVKNTAKVCPACGIILKQESEPLPDKEIIEAILSEITPADILATKPYDYSKELNTFEELQRFQQAKKYKFGWVIHQCIERNIPIPSKYNYMRSVILSR